MGFIGQILSVKAHGAESVHEKITQMLKTEKDLLSLMREEEEIEIKLKEAEHQGHAHEIFRLQKEELGLAVKTLGDIKHILVELFALTDNEKHQLDMFIADGQRLMKEGLSQNEETRLLQELQEQKHAISELFRSTKYTAGFER